MPSHKKTNSLQQGFTMVEMSIVIIAIGIILAGLISGARLYNNAQLYSSYSHVKIYQSALEEFIIKYNALPGDLDDITRLNNCGGCANGNGNGIIGTANQAIFTQTAAASENTQSFYHLQAAGFIKDMVSGNAPAGTDGFGEVLPASKLRGGFVMRSVGGQFNDNGAPLKGIYIIWKNMPFTAANTANGLVLSPVDAEQLDIKFDDGSPLTGFMRARGTANNNAADNCKLSATDYVDGSAAIACYAYFQIRQSPSL